MLFDFMVHEVGKKLSVRAYVIRGGFQVIIERYQSGDVLIEIADDCIVQSQEEVSRILARITEIAKEG